MPDPAANLNITIVSGQVWELVLRFAFNLLIAFILIRLIYYRSQKNPTYAFTYFMFNVLIFFVCYLLSNVTLSIGFAFGLFAVFAILRYRTDPIPIKEMTYLFMVITIGVMNALSTPNISLVELLFANGAIVLVAFVMESYWRKTILSEVRVTYEKIENIKPENQAALLSDLRERTGLDIVKYKMIRTDFLRDVARIQVYYRGSTDQD
ncbi:DUF4956 domain-containing protein [Candidatus Neomarinimicrobiota bacterium]